MHHLPCLFTPARGLLAAALSGLLLITACGGGGGDGATASDTPPTATAAAFTQGTITGFGSVIVNGVRFDDSGCTVTDDSGTAQALSALRLGMRVEIDSSAVDTSTATARAHALRFGDLVTGPVEAVDAAAGTLTLLQDVLLPPAAAPCIRMPVRPPVVVAAVLSPVTLNPLTLLMVWLTPAARLSISTP